MKAILGRKIGMTQVFQDDGSLVPVTVVEAGPCVVTQKKTVETDGYAATQLAFEETKPKKLTKPEMGHLRKAGVAPHRHLVEVRGESELTVGDSVTVENFETGDQIRVSGVGKGKGFQGVVKRHGFRGGPETHGSRLHRAPGSIGASASPSKVFKGQRLPGQMGNRKVTQTGLQVVDTDTERNLLLIKGAVPGSKGSLVFVRG